MIHPQNTFYIHSSYSLPNRRPFILVPSPVPVMSDPPPPTNLGKAEDASSSSSSSSAQNASDMKFFNPGSPLWPSIEREAIPRLYSVGPIHGNWGRHEYDIPSVSNAFANLSIDSRDEGQSQNQVPHHHCHHNQKDCSTPACQWQHQYPLPKPEVNNSTVHSMQTTSQIPNPPGKPASDTEKNNAPINPTPIPLPDDPFATINRIIKKVQDLERGMNELQFTSTQDKNYRLVEEMLTRCLLELDQISPEGGNIEEFRLHKKHAIEYAEKCLSDLEKKVIPPNSVLSEIHDIMDRVKDFEKQVDNLEIVSNTKGKKYLYLEEMLTRCLMELDEIKSDGREDIRNERKQGVLYTERCIAKLEAKLK